jgi:hypothetical protein
MQAKNELGEAAFDGVSVVFWPGAVTGASPTKFYVRRVV